VSNVGQIRIVTMLAVDEARRLWIKRIKEMKVKCTYVEPMGEASQNRMQRGKAFCLVHNFQNLIDVSGRLSNFNTLS